MAQNEIKLSTVTNTALYKSFEDSRKKLIDGSIPPDKKKIDKACGDMIKKGVYQAHINDKPDGKERFHEFLLSEEYAELVKKKKSMVNSANDDDGLIYRVVPGGENYKNYSIETGRYVGFFDLDKVKSGMKLVITTGYSNDLFVRMLAAAMGVHTDTSISGNARKSDDLYSMIAHLLFLVTLKKVASTALPQKYVSMTERGYSVRGNIDINAYINYDLPAADKKLTSRYQERSDVQNVIDVLNAAMKKCHVIDKGSVLPSASGLEAYLREHASARPPRQDVIGGILKEKCLANSLYAGYKDPLRYAQMILGGGNTDTLSGSENTAQFLIDSAALWEMYLYRLMKEKLSGWKVEWQAEMEVYQGTFFKGKYYPDFILTSDDGEDIYVLDAKFKTMNFKSMDLDRDDFHQLHDYSFYYHLKYGKRYKGTCIVYPSKKDPEGKTTQAPMYGLPDVKERFGVITLKDSPGSNQLEKNENDFIERLTAFLERA